MLQASRVKNTGGWKSTPFLTQIHKRLKEGMLIGCGAIGLFLIISLTTNSPADPGWSHTGSEDLIQNSAGRIGAWISDLLFSWFGLVAYLVSMTVIYMGIVAYRASDEEIAEEEALPPWRLWVLRSTGLLLTILSSCGLSSLHFAPGALPMTAGGYIGAIVSYTLVSQLNIIGTSVILLGLLLMGVTFLTGISWLALTEWVGAMGLYSARRGWSWFQDHLEKGTFQRLYHQAIEKIKSKAKVPQILQNVGPVVASTAVAVRASVMPMVAPKRVPVVVPEVADRPVSHMGIMTPSTSTAAAEAPSLALLESVVEGALEGAYSQEDLTSLSRLVETRLEEFGISAVVVDVLPGPVITRFELDLAAGIKVSKITALAKDLARALSVVSVRVVEVIPGKPLVGLEIPNAQRELVRLKEILQDEGYQQAISPLTLALGKDIAGRPITADLAKMPHLLVAGTTGAGKSVGVNAMLLSILYKASPDQVRLILIDPKMLELAIYDHIPHLLTPVVTDMREAANALRWCVEEMEQRYQRMAALGVRHLTGYNQKLAEATSAGEPLRDPLWNVRDHNGEEAPLLTHLPYIVVVVDEFADMMLVVGKKVEDLIARIAQKARAAGIHLILATQRPSVDVITGLIKANIPTRIAFQVSCKIDSRTILDQSGAEQLLGHGDMLYMPPGSGIPTRIHGAFVADEEVHKVVNEWRKKGKPCYIEAVVTSAGSTGSDEEDEYDALYDEAVSIVIESRRPSISHVQRRLKVGYNRAARLIEKMEREGVVTPIQPNGTREVLAPSSNG